MAGNTSKPKLPPMAAGQRYGRLVAMEFVERGRQGTAHWRFRCDCGKETVTSASRARCGSTRSCGCLHIETATNRGRQNRTHGLGTTPEYSLWKSMIQRCGNPEDAAFSNYGGRGISVCDRWLDFETFLSDLGPRPKGMTLERKNNDAGYSPDNVKWATWKEQSRNKRTSRFMETPWGRMTVAEAAERAGISLNRFKSRMNGGWTMNDLFDPKFSGKLTRWSRR